MIHSMPRSSGRTVLRDRTTFQIASSGNLEHIFEDWASWKAAYDELEARIAE